MADDKKAHLDVGLFQLRAERVEGLPLVSARAYLRGGARLEPNPGWSYVTARLLSEGTERRDYRELSEAAEERGAWFQTSGSGETATVAVDAQSADAKWALDHLLELLLEPTFPEDRLDWLRRQVVAELESQLDQPDVRTGYAFIDQLFSPHPYGRPIQGDAESLAALDPDACRSLHQRSLGWGGCISVAGHIDPKQVVEALADRLQALPKVMESMPESPSIVGDPNRREVDLPAGDQAHYFLGTTTVGRTHPDLAALELLGVVLGSGGLSGRLPLLLREKEGLAYHVEVAAAAGAGLDPGRFVVYLGTSKQLVAKAEALIYDQLTHLQKNGIADEELEEARGYLLGRAPFRFETLRQRAELMAEAALYGTQADDPDWWPSQLRAVTANDLERVAKTWLEPEHMRVTVGLPSPKS